MRNKWKLLQNAWPAALTGILIACAASAMEPTLASVPELLEYTASNETSSTEKPKLKDKASLTNMSSGKKKEKKKSSSEAFADQDSYADGTYTGTAQGFGGPITVQVTVSGGKITDVTILSAGGETASYFSQAQGVISRIISSGSPNVDTVSGATFSSNGILNAIKRALSSAGGSTADLNILELTPVVQDSTPVILAPVTIDPSAITSKPSNTLKDGNYIGSAYGFGGNITVSVNIANGKLAGINVISASGETGSYFNRAQAVIPQILSAQSADVDSVSGATYSSTGIKNAVKNAIAQAITNPPQSSDTSGSADSEANRNPDKNPDKGEATKPETDHPSVPGEGSNPSSPSTEKEEPIVFPDLQKKELSEIEEMPKMKLKDGIFRGLGEGFGGDIELEITVQEGKIVQIEVISAEKETPAFFNKAKELLGTILDRQSQEIDVVSGATYSSEGILEALEEALKEAEIVEEIEEKVDKEDADPEDGTGNVEDIESEEGAEVHDQNY